MSQVCTSEHIDWFIPMPTMQHHVGALAPVPLSKDLSGPHVTGVNT
jgi:hypothetical protein